MVFDERKQVAFDALLGGQRVQPDDGRCGTGWARRRGARAPRSGRPPSASAAGILAREQRPAEHARAAEHAQDRRRHERVAGVDRQRPAAAKRANTATATTPTIAPGARARPATEARARPPSAAPTSTGGRRISPMRRGCTRARLAMPVTRSSVCEWWRVFVSDHRASPVIARSLRRGPPPAGRPPRAASGRPAPPASARAAMGRAPADAPPATPGSCATARLSQAGVRSCGAIRSAPGGPGDQGTASTDPRTPTPPGRSSPASASSSQHWPARPGGGGTPPRAPSTSSRQGMSMYARTAIGEHGHACDQQLRRALLAARPNQRAPQGIHHPDARRQRQEGERNGHMYDARADSGGKRARRRGIPTAGWRWCDSPRHMPAGCHGRADRPRRGHRGCRS